MIGLLNKLYSLSRHSAATRSPLGIHSRNQTASNRAGSYAFQSSSKHPDGHTQFKTEKVDTLNTLNHFRLISSGFLTCVRSKAF